eukprot:gb/GEZN01013040.1/.p1 GENE.gb/GEZN01013040.1/~~gb/GEZN01013040.1/.p1  ORF type:complete len:172 (-),score=12.52 gb/GEZN01013040.1/:415-930(-)
MPKGSAESTACLAGFVMFAAIAAMVGAWSTTQETLPLNCSVVVRQNLWGHVCTNYRNCQANLQNYCVSMGNDEMSSGQKAAQAFVSLQLLFSILALFTGVILKEEGLNLLASLWGIAGLCGIIAMIIWVVNHQEDHYGWGFGFSVVGWIVSLLLSFFLCFLTSKPRIQDYR